MNTQLNWARKALAVAAIVFGFGSAGALLGREALLREQAAERVHIATEATVAYTCLDRRTVAAHAASLTWRTPGAAQVG